MHSTFYERLNSDRPTAAVVPVLKPILCDFLVTGQFYFKYPFYPIISLNSFLSVTEWRMSYSLDNPAVTSLKEGPGDRDPHPF